MQTPAPSTLQASAPPEAAWDWQRLALAHGWRPRRRAWRPRLGRTLGFWLGGVVGGAAGCLFGAGMEYQSTLAVTPSVIGWSIYYGTLGASMGVLLGLLGERFAASHRVPKK
jgi:hypothetical protein